MSALADIVRDLEPIHETMARFEKGGPQCARDIERIHDALVALVGRLEDDYDNEDDE